MIEGLRDPVTRSKLTRGDGDDRQWKLKRAVSIGRAKRASDPAWNSLSHRPWPTVSFRW